MSIRLQAMSGIAIIVLNSTAQAEVPQVATDIAPVHSLVARVMDGLGEPSLIVRHGASPHGYAMRPSEARNLQEADAIFWVGPELEPWLQSAIGNLAPDAKAVSLLSAEGTQTLEFRTGARFQSNHDDHDHGQETGHEEDHQDHQDHDEHQDHEEHGSGIDPHGWLDPENAKHWMGIIASSLTELDPENAATYAANAEAGRGEIDVATQDAKEILKPVTNGSFVVFHDAYHYFENHFGVLAAGAIALSDASDPSPARIESVRETVQDLGVTCVFSEPQFNQGLLATVTEGTSAQGGVVDPQGTDLPIGSAFYPELIRSIATALATCGAE